MTAGEFAAWASGLLAVLGILAVLLRVAIKLDRVEQLAKELKPNGGGSMRDAVHRIETKVDDAAQTLAEHETRISRNEGRVEAIALVMACTM